MQAIIRMVDVFPAPLGPRKPNTSPRSIERSMPATATSSPNLFSRRLARTIGERASMAVMPSCLEAPLMGAQGPSETNDSSSRAMTKPCRRRTGPTISVASRLLRSARQPLESRCAQASVGTFHLASR